jgi:Tfp pilus assembly protein PilF
LLFVYMGRVDRVVSVALVVGWVAAGPLVTLMEPVLVASQNPVLQASLQTVEEGADPVAAAVLETAAAENPEDRDLAYLVALQHKKAGRYDDAARSYEALLASNASDPVALNNLGTLDYLRGDYRQATERFNAAAQSGPPKFRATATYNRALTELQEFAFDESKETRAQADAIAGGLPARYERLWNFEQEGSAVPAVVDLGPSPDEVWAKFAGEASGSGRPNLAGSDASPLGSDALVSGVVSRFLWFILVFGAVVLVLSRWRGQRLFTLRCLKCGTPFCKLCHLGTAQSELCTQCHHLFVVRDGVSAPARNRKMAEVAEEEERRRRWFRVLSLISPGAGHVHARKPVLGVILVAIWYGVIGLVLAALLVPVVAAPSRLGNPVVLASLGTLLLIVFAVANLTTPSFETKLSKSRRGGRRPPVNPGRRG